jgi:RNA polymerase sigma factor (sigma-70 family)
MRDSEALASYAERADPEAFAALVERYQGLVFSACRRVLGNAGEVEDAVQETFIKLARQAGSVRRNPASWIFTCALNTARDKRRSDQARREREAAWAETASAGAESARGWQDLLPVVDECIAELPQEERELLIQCYLLRRTQEAVAAEQGISRPTLRRRLDGAVESLREGLRRRGVAVSAAVLGAWLLDGACEAAVPAALSQSLAKIGLAGVGGSASAPVPVSTAATAVAKSAWTAFVGSGTVKAVLAVAACVALLAGFVLLWQRLQPSGGLDGPQASLPTAPPPAAAPAPGAVVAAQSEPEPEVRTPSPPNDGRDEAAPPPPPPVVTEVVAAVPAPPRPPDEELPAVVAAALGQYGAVHVLAGSPEAFAAITPGLLAAWPGKAQAMAPGGAIPGSPVVVGEVGEVCFGFLREGLMAPGARAEAEKALKRAAAVLVEVDRQVEGQTPYQISEADPKTGKPGKLLASMMLDDYLALYAEVREYRSGQARR